MRFWRCGQSNVVASVIWTTVYGRVHITRDKYLTNETRKSHSFYRPLIRNGMAYRIFKCNSSHGCHYCRRGQQFRGLINKIFMARSVVRTLSDSRACGEYNITHSQCESVVRRTIKVNGEWQTLTPPPPLSPLTDFHQNWQM